MASKNDTDIEEMQIKKVSKVYRGRDTREYVKMREDLNSKKRIREGSKKRYKRRFLLGERVWEGDLSI